jgi:hypothetical protein
VTWQRYIALGHGISVPANERWYWSGLIFEPNARGAREVVNAWKELLLRLRRD